LKILHTDSIKENVLIYLIPFLAKLGSLLEACQGKHLLVQTTWGQLELDK